MKLAIENVSKEVFQSYGQLIEMPVKDDPTIAVENVTFWKQQAMFSIKGETEVGVLKIKKQDMVFDQLENHFKTATGIICLDGDCVIAVAPPSDDIPNVDTLKAYTIPQGQLFVLAEKCWHSATYPIDKDEITLLIIFQKDALDNDTVFEDISESVELTF
ncbi:ureidoglycolate lyase [Pseudocolwellia agarivorans]|uniref:ureidoglycolate lyase n=1 Tax=Pseudocolwellia agarivorans TaxID=1911682 RepID=UPI0009850880|nr:ureidoglycolate lyase [Pseudocolwellia agarivorans]